MGHGVQRVFDATIASFATASSEIDLGRSFMNIAIEVPTMTSNSQVHIQIANSSGGTFRRLSIPMVNTSTVSSPDFAIASSVTNRVVSLPLPMPARYLKVETTAIVSFSAAFKVLCGD